MLMDHAPSGDGERILQRSIVCKVASNRLLSYPRTARILGALIGLLLSALPASAGYLLDVGDVIEISVAGVPDLQRRVSIQLDGSISFPLLGTIAVAGLSPLQVQAKIQAALATKIIRRKTADGRDDTVTIEPYDVTATVVEYRPIYVNGDVSKPGEYPYRPLMTVHQAIALSGGYDVGHATINNPFLQVADLRADYESLWLEFVKEQLHVGRLRAELAGKDSIDLPEIGEGPVSRSAVAEMIKLENDELKTRLTDYQREKAFLQRSIKQAGQQVDVLSEQSSKELEGVQADADELKRALDLFGKGTLTSSRVTDARRAVLLSSTRQLQTASQLMQVRKQQDEFSRQLERLDDQRKAALLQELQDASLKAGEIRAKLGGAQMKLQYAASVRSQLAAGSGVKPLVTVLRKGENGWESSTAAEEFELQPGDVVEIAFRQESASGSYTR
jgi:polysaccharide export outer membrane protein